MYALLCDYAADKDHCWPSQSTLAKRLSCSISSVKNYLGELVREKLISVKREQYRSSVYYLLRPAELVEKQKTEFTNKQSEADCYEAKSGYLTNLSKQSKEKDSPLSPHALGETTVNPVRRAFRAPAGGGVSSTLQDFESPWALYPKKDAKGFARMAWFKVLRSGPVPPLPELHAAIRRFASSEGWQREQGRFVPQMGNWLRGQRWLDPLPPAQQAEQRHDLELRQAMRAREEQERLLLERQKVEKARLRPLFEAFSAKFAPSSHNAMAFGIWLHLHSLSCAPSGDDVPPANTMGIVGNHGTSQAIRRESGTSDCRPLDEILKTLPSVARLFQTGNRAGWPLASPMPAYA